MEETTSTPSDIVEELESSGQQLHWADYLVFAISLLASLLVGVAFAIKDRWRSQSSESYLMADRSLHWFVVGVSTFASYINAILFVGPFVEYYYIGLEFAWIVPSICLSLVYTMLVTVPKFFRLGFQITSAYEYFEKRFNLITRIIAAFIFVAGTGGMKAVAWVDNLQVGILFLALVIMAIKGTAHAGGIDVIWQRYRDAGRGRLVDTDLSPWNRHTAWNMIVFMAISYTASTGANQMALQRYMTINNMKNAQISLIITGIMFSCAMLLMMLVAMAAFANVGGNEPLLTKKITKTSQIFPYYMMWLLGHIPGLPGLIVSAILAAALSTLSSGQNSLAAVFLEDFVRPLHRIRTGRAISDTAAGHVSRAAGMVFGVLVMVLGLSFISSTDMIFSLMISVGSFIVAPLFVLMVVGFFVPFAESWGAIIGCLSSLLFAVQLHFGSQASTAKIGYDFAPRYLKNFTVEVTVPTPSVEPTFYDISYTWYTAMDILVGVVVAVIVSTIVTIVKYRAAKKISPTTKWSEFYADRSLLYTMDDFLAGLKMQKDYRGISQQDTDTVPEANHLEPDNCAA